MSVKRLSEGGVSGGAASSVAALSGQHAHDIVSLQVGGVGAADRGERGGGGERIYSKDYAFQLPIYMSSFCKECRAVVTPCVVMSDETWKMSFGKFMEMTFYNRSARCRTSGCTHNLRDCHRLDFYCENYVCHFDFVPIHPFSLHIRSTMDFPLEFHNQQTFKMLVTLPAQFHLLCEEFR